MAKLIKIIFSELMRLSDQITSVYKIMSSNYYIFFLIVLVKSMGLCETGNISNLMIVFFLLIRSI